MTCRNCGSNDTIITKPVRKCLDCGSEETLGGVILKDE